ncbi:hypothetical protein ScPMuIL_012445 [Solemya velum]
MLAVQKELREIDQNIESTVNKNIPSQEYKEYKLQLKVFQRKISEMIKKSSQLSQNSTTQTAPRRNVQKISSDSNEQNNRKHSIHNYRIRSKSGVYKNRNITHQYIIKTGRSIISSDTSKKTDRERLHYCPEFPPDLSGVIKVNFNETENLAYRDISIQHPDILPGGMWRPSDCVSRHRVAIIIPFRDRKRHLTILLANLLPVLKRQQLHFRIYLVEQFGNDTFNKGRIMNAAFGEAIRTQDFDCFVFHDVDLIPEDDRNMYSCPENPRHLSVAVDEMKYRLWYDLLVGGVLNMRSEHFQIVNGYSNMYWGWGAEDDDMAYRILQVGLKISRPPANIARYKMIPHAKREPTNWKKRTRLLQTVRKRFRYDGLNSVEYELLFMHLDPLFTHILVDVGKPP